MISSDQRADSRPGGRVETLRFCSKLVQQPGGADAQHVDAKVPLCTKLRTLMHNDHRCPHGDVGVPRAQEPLQVSSDLGDLTTPAPPSPIGELAPLYQVAVPVELVEPPVIASDIDPYTPPLDLDRPHTTRPYQHVIHLAATIGIAAKHRPVIGEDPQVLRDPILSTHAYLLLGQTMRQRGIHSRRPLAQRALLPTVPNPGPPLPPPPRPGIREPKLAHRPVMVDHTSPLLGKRELGLPQLRHRLIGQLLDQHPPTITTKRSNIRSGGNARLIPTRGTATGSEANLATGPERPERQERDQCTGSVH